MWRTDLLIDAAELGLRDRESQLAAEQAVYGLDALSETELQPIVAAALTSAGYGVLREQPYPSEWRAKRQRRKSTIPNPADRLRCDLVVTPRTGQLLADSLRAERSIVEARRELAGGLFEGLAAAPSGMCSTLETGAGQCPWADASTGGGDTIESSDVFWLEVKLVSQFCYSHGVPGPNRTYSGELRRSIRDLAKLDADPGVHRGGLLLLTFTATEEVARHDVLALVHAALDRETPVGSPEMRVLRVGDRIGNSVLTLSLLELKKPPPG